MNEISEILRLHGLWLDDAPGGERNNARGATGASTQPKETP